jgi:hypothetical protein
MHNWDQSDPISNRRISEVHPFEIFEIEEKKSQKCEIHEFHHQNLSFDIFIICTIYWIYFPVRLCEKVQKWTQKVEIIDIFRIWKEETSERKESVGSACTYNRLENL